MAEQQKLENGERWKQSIWYAIERLGIPTVLLVIACLWLGKPMVDSYRTAMEEQTKLAQQCTASLISIEKIVSEDKAERKAEMISEVKASILRHEESARERDTKMLMLLERVTACLEKVAANGNHFEG